MKTTKKENKEVELWQSEAKNRALELIIYLGFVALMLASFWIVLNQFKATNSSKVDQEAIDVLQGDLEELTQKTYSANSKGIESVRAYIMKRIQDQELNPEIIPLSIDVKNSKIEFKHIYTMLEASNKTKDTSTVLVITNYDAPYLSKGVANPGLTILSILNAMNNLDKVERTNNIAFLFLEGEEYANIGTKELETVLPELELESTYIIRPEGYSNRGNVVISNLGANDYKTGMFLKETKSEAVVNTSILPILSTFIYKSDGAELLKGMGFSGLSYYGLGDLGKIGYMDDSLEELDTQFAMKYLSVTQQIIEKSVNYDFAQYSDNTKAFVFSLSKGPMIIVNQTNMILLMIFGFIFSGVGFALTYHKVTLYIRGRYLADSILYSVVGMILFGGASGVAYMIFTQFLTWQFSALVSLGLGSIVFALLAVKVEKVYSRETLYFFILLLALLAGLLLEAVSVGSSVWMVLVMVVVTLIRLLEKYMKGLVGFTVMIVVAVVGVGVLFFGWMMENISYLMTGGKEMAGILFAFTIFPLTIVIYVIRTCENVLLNNKASHLKSEKEI